MAEYMSSSAARSGWPGRSRYFQSRCWAKSVLWKTTMTKSWSPARSEPITSWRCRSISCWQLSASSWSDSLPMRPAKSSSGGMVAPSSGGRV
jgi:hypothetical protein